MVRPVDTPAFFSLAMPCAALFGVTVTAPDPSGPLSLLRLRLPAASVASLLGTFGRLLGCDGVAPGGSSATEAVGGGEDDDGALLDNVTSAAVTTRLTMTPASVSPQTASIHDTAHTAHTVTVQTHGGGEDRERGGGMQ